MHECEHANQFNSLNAWIQPQHLEGYALQSYRKSFEMHPARLLVLENFLEETVAEQLSKLLCDEAEFWPIYGLYSSKGKVSEEEWVSAEERDRFFRYSKLGGVPLHYRMSPNTITYLRFKKALENSKFKMFFEAISGLPLRWSDTFGAHSMKTGDFLKLHDDKENNRRLALVIYLSPDWEPRFGGALKLVDQQGRRTTVEARYNSMVAFDVTASIKHYIEQITPDAGTKPRLTISGWYQNAD